MAKPKPWAFWMMAVLTPITSPWALSKGPPELPGLIAASVWRKSTRLSAEPTWELLRPLALIIPVVTVLSSPKGLPMAIAHSPTCRASESPKLTIGRFSPLILTTAISVKGSAPTTCPSKVRPSLRVTVTWFAPSTTWALVRISPLVFMINPEPIPLWVCFSGIEGICPPKNCRNIGSSKPWGAWVVTVREALILTTAGPTRSTTSVTKLVEVSIRGDDLASWAMATGAEPTNHLDWDIL